MNSANLDFEESCIEECSSTAGSSRLACKTPYGVRMLPSTETMMWAVIPSVAAQDHTPWVRC